MKTFTLTSHSIWTRERKTARAFADEVKDTLKEPRMAEDDKPFNYATGPYEFHLGQWSNEPTTTRDVVLAIAAKHGMTVEELHPGITKTLP